MGRGEGEEIGFDDVQRFGLEAEPVATVERMPGEIYMWTTAAQIEAVKRLRRINFAGLRKETEEVLGRAASLQSEDEMLNLSGAAHGVHARVQMLADPLAVLVPNEAPRGYGGFDEMKLISQSEEKQVTGLYGAGSNWIAVGLATARFAKLLLELLTQAEAIVEGSPAYGMERP